jgi:hypothetical protein
MQTVQISIYFFSGSIFEYLPSHTGLQNYKEELYRAKKRKSIKNDSRSLRFITAFVPGATGLGRRHGAHYRGRRVDFLMKGSKE